MVPYIQYPYAYIEKWGVSKFSRLCLFVRIWSGLVY